MKILKLWLVLLCTGLAVSKTFASNSSQEEFEKLAIEAVGRLKEEADNLREDLRRYELFMGDTQTNEQDKIELAQKISECKSKLAFIIPEIYERMLFVAQFHLEEQEMFNEELSKLKKEFDTYGMDYPGFDQDAKDYVRRKNEGMAIKKAADDNLFNYKKLRQGRETELLTGSDSLALAQALESIVELRAQYSYNSNEYKELDDLIQRLMTEEPRVRDDVIDVHSGVLYS